MRVGVLVLTMVFASTPAIATAGEGDASPDQQGRYLSRCIVDLGSGGQIAVINAASESACASAGQRCAGSRIWTAIQWNNDPLYTKPNSAEVCEIAG